MPSSKPPAFAPTRPDVRRTPDTMLGERVGSFVLQRLLGAGPAGATYDATGDAHWRASVKVLQPEFVRSQALDFARLDGMQQHPGAAHIARVLEYGRAQNGLAYIATEMLDGRDLSAILERTGSLPPAIATKLVLQACAGLEIAHRSGVVHADLKPSNLFLAFAADKRVTLKLLDFGVAKPAGLYSDHDLTRTGASLGSPMYMAPEQLAGAGEINARVDVWSLAAILYELICGVTPYGDTGSLADLVVSVCTTNAPSIQERAPWVTPDLTLAIHRALNRLPERRTPSVTEFARALQASMGTDSTATRGDLAPPQPSLKSRLEPLADLAAALPPEGDAFGHKRATAAPDRFLGKVIAGKYRIVHLIGRGGMGSVYEAVAQGDTRVAVKIMSSVEGADARMQIARFLREAKAAMAIDSPYVARTLDVGADEATSSHFIVMELLHGVDLSVLYRRHGALEQDALVRVFLQAAKGLAAAHAAGVIHRDIKPANIFLATDPQTGKVIVKVCDFGVAKRVASALDESTAAGNLTQTGGILGSPMYMSPEQVQSAKHVDFGSDIWSLAISLYEGLTGSQPWQGCDTIGQIIIAICTRDLPRLEQVSPWVAPALARAVHAALAREPRERTASVAEFIAELATISGGKQDVSRDELRGVEHKVRAGASMRPPPGTLSPGIDTAQVMQNIRGRPRVVWGAGAVVVVFLGVGVWAMSRSKAPDTLLQPPAAEASSAASATASTASAPPPGANTAAGSPKPSAEDFAASAPFHAPMAIDPPDATVTIDGRPAVVLDGKLTLHGQAGVAFQLVVSKGKARRELTAFITFDGKASPSEVRLEAAAISKPSVARATTKRKAERRATTTSPTQKRVAPLGDW